MPAPRVFISYSWNSSEGSGHEEWVLGLAIKLRKSGVNIRLDKWHVAPGESLTKFMEQEVASADFVVAICTPIFAEKSNARSSGVGYEQQIVSGQIVMGADRSKFIPVIRKGSLRPGPEFSIPTHFIGAYALDFRNDDVFEQSIEELIRAIYKKPRHVPPELGSPPAFLQAVSENNDGILQILVDSHFNPLNMTEFTQAFDELVDAYHSRETIRIQILVQGYEDKIVEFDNILNRKNLTIPERARRRELRTFMQDLRLLDRPWSTEVNILHDAANGFRLGIEEWYLKHQILTDRSEVIRVLLVFFGTLRGRWPSYEGGLALDAISPENHNIVIDLNEAETARLLAREKTEAKHLTVFWGLRLGHLEREILISRAAPLILREYFRLNWSGKPPASPDKYFDILEWKIGLH